jgi:hypothetical protein
MKKIDKKRRKFIFRLKRDIKIRAMSWRNYKQRSKRLSYVLFSIQNFRKKKKIQETKMFVMDYWKQFKPISQGWHKLMALFYIFVSLLAFVTNLMVIYYLTR